MEGDGTQGIEEACLVMAILDESTMKSLMFGKEIKSVFGWLVYSHSFSSHINDSPSQH